jgi:hypothetical protein
MTYKEFYIWLEGFMTNREWTVIKEIDIETIQEKMKEVKNGDIGIKIREFDFIPTPVNPLSKERLND